jgi:hypothetical protein
MRTTWEAYFKLFCVYFLGAMTLSKMAFAVPPLSITGHSIITLQNSAQHNNTLRLDNDTYYDTILSKLQSPKVDSELQLRLTSINVVPIMEPSLATFSRMTHNIMKLCTMTLSITTPCITIHSITTLNITLYNKTKLSITLFNKTILSIRTLNTQNNYTQKHFAIIGCIKTPSRATFITIKALKKQYCARTVSVVVLPSVILLYAILPNVLAPFFRCQSISRNARGRSFLADNLRLISTLYPSTQNRSCKIFGSLTFVEKTFGRRKFSLKVRTNFDLDLIHFARNDF